MSFFAVRFVAIALAGFVIALIESVYELNCADLTITFRARFPTH